MCGDPLIGRICSLCRRKRWIQIVSLCGVNRVIQGLVVSTGVTSSPGKTGRERFRSRFTVHSHPSMRKARLPVKINVRFVGRISNVKNSTGLTAMAPFIADAMSASYLTCTLYVELVGSLQATLTTWMQESESRN